MKKKVYIKTTNIRVYIITSISYNTHIIRIPMYSFFFFFLLNHFEFLMSYIVVFFFHSILIDKLNCVIVICTFINGLLIRIENRFVCFIQFPHFHFHPEILDQICTICGRRSLSAFAVMAYLFRIDW